MSVIKGLKRVSVFDYSVMSVIHIMVLCQSYTLWCYIIHTMVLCQPYTLWRYVSHAH